MKTALEQNRDDQALGAAWRRCEAALPEGWTFSGLMPRIHEGWLARAANRYPDEIEGTGPTPTAALEALAEALEARKAQECPGGVGHVGHDPNSGPGSDWCPACGGYARVAP